MRSVTATVRRMEKEAQRRHKQQVKEQITADAFDAVNNWENYLEEILSIHTDLADRIDWDKMLSKPSPTPPKRIARHAKQAESALLHFKPGALDFLKGGSAKRKAALKQELSSALEKDQNEYNELLRQHERALSEWEDDRKLAKRLTDGDAEAIKEVISEYLALHKTDLIGSSVHFRIRDGVVHALPNVHSDEVVPNFRRKQLASGKLSETKMPIGQFNELYQDYVASVALKVAGDLFQILPIDEVYVTCESTMLNSSTGHQEPTPILSVQFVRSTFETLNLNRIDPSDSMGNFNHRMQFSRTKGFSAVSPIIDDE